MTEPINMMHGNRADAAQWGDDMLETHSVTAALGAEVSGLDLGGALSEADIDSIHEALMQHQVLFFRDQSLDPPGMLALAERLGEVDAGHPVYPHAP